EKVLAEAALFALERVGKRLERAVVGAAQDASAAAVVEKSVHRFLEHALLVAHDDVRGVQLHQLLEAVVAVDDAPVEIVQVGSGKAPAIEWHKRTELGREHRENVQNHPLGLVAALAECLQHLQALGVLDALLEAGVDFHFFAELFGELFDVHAAEKLLDGFGAHAGTILPGILALQLAILLLVEQLLFLDARGLAGIDDDEGLEVKDVLEVAHGDVEQVTDTAGQALEEPDVRTRRSELNVAEALATDLAERDFHAALVADDAAVLHALVLAAQAFPVGDRAKNLGAEQAVTLGFERAVVYGFRLGHLAVGPGPDLFRACQADANGIE